MKFGVLGTGMVGKALASKLVACGHEVRMGARSAENEAATSWAHAGGDKASHGTFADAAGFGEVVFLCTKGDVAVQVIEAAGPDNLRGKVVVDVTNPLDFSAGFPPTLFTTGTESLGERVQAAAPDARVVKTLNTLNAELMVDPARVPGEHDLLMCGNDEDAKQAVRRILTEDFGWKIIHDLGPLDMARGTESYLPLWVRLYGALGTPDFNIHIQIKR
jgi:8-hydroxy-5-deazaflavin:NADPH oxidoreductase